jgi:hypothetical protein
MMPAASLLTVLKVAGQTTTCAGGGKRLAWSGRVGSALPGQDRVPGGLLGGGLVQPGEGCGRGDDADEPAGFDRGGGHLVHPGGQRGTAGDQREVVRHRSVQRARA